MDIYQLLEKLNIDYEEITHKAVYTIKEAEEENIANKIEGIECKNLFVKSKEKYYLILIKKDKKADLKLLSSLVKEKKLTFAEKEELKSILNLEIGSVTPLGIMNDRKNLVTLLLDKELENKKILLHPNINTKTISINYHDLIKIINYTNHKYNTF